VKKISTILALSLTLSLTAATAAVVDRSSDTIKLSYESSEAFEYDAANGWWWYKQEVEDKNGKKHKIKERMSTKEKLKHENQSKLIKAISAQTKVIKKQSKDMEIVKERLEYAYPNITPIYSKDRNGKKCLTNSSEECFVFPLQAEAQHVPVLAGWLSDPSPTNSKKWLRWEAKYFNHLQKISLGNRFAFLNGGPSAYPTDTTFVYNDNLSLPMSERVKKTRETNIIDSLKDKLGIIIFLGGNTLLEESLSAYKKVYQLTESPWKDMNITVVVPSEKMKKFITDKVKNIHVKKTQKFWDNHKILVKPEAFKHFNVIITPSIISTYKTDKINEKNENQIIWQNVSVGTTGVEKIRGGIMKFLVYNDIIQPGEMATAINAASQQKNMETNDATVREDKIYEDTNSFNIK